MVDVAVVTSKLALLERRLQRIVALRPLEPLDLGNDEDQLDLISFNLMLCVQACADIASHLIADEGWPAASSLAEGFARLRERGVLSRETELALTRAVGLRNVVAHGYAGIDLAAIRNAATVGVSDLERFAKEVATWLGAG